MYIRITRGRVDPGRYDDLLRVAPDIIAAIKRLAGCQDCVGGGDRTDGRTSVCRSR